MMADEFEYKYQKLIECRSQNVLELFYYRNFILSYLCIHAIAKFGQSNSYWKCSIQKDMINGSRFIIYE